MTIATESSVEKEILKTSFFKALYPPTEKIKTIMIDNFPALGKLTALRFIEWVLQNPDGVISLPTGKTPEYFIKWVESYMANWKERNIQQELSRFGIITKKKPDLSNLSFVQIDEFYPINPHQHNSFYHYINSFYIKKFGLNKEKALLIDCSKIGLAKDETIEDLWPDLTVDLGLRFRHPATALERKQKNLLYRLDQWCQEYEETIRSRGGIGFFLGGIGPDGHIGFNVFGSDHYSTTRLTPTNYETQAAAAVDLGGIEISRKRLVITIGLGTITYNKDCTAIIMAAGESKASIIRNAVEQEKNVKYPATALQILPNARFYITTGAGKLLKERACHLLAKSKTLSDQQVEKIVIDLAFTTNKKITDLAKTDFARDPLGSMVLKIYDDARLKDLCEKVRDNLIKKIEEGSNIHKHKTFLHTEPHHDDLMLGCLPFIVRHTRIESNNHCFVYITSGFTSVTNSFMIEELIMLRTYIESKEFKTLYKENYFEPGNEHGRDRDIWQYLDGVAANDYMMKTEGIARRLLRNIIAIYGDGDINSIKKKVAELEHYFTIQQPGIKDPKHIQQLKGMRREWEAECLWGYIGWNTNTVEHLRLGFYTGDIFTQTPSIDRDVMPLYNYLAKVQPDIITIAFDPEASGPDTHYKSLQIITEALKIHEKETGRSDISVWGYRNVWYRFDPSEANIYVPVSLNMFAIMQNAFMNSFLSQKNASFPSYEHDGPFSELAQKIQVEQYQKIKTCLGREWFNEHESPLIRATRGLVFLKTMTLEELYASSLELKEMVELTHQSQ